MKLNTILIGIALLTCALPSVLQAADSVWMNVVSDYWTNSVSWLPTAVPSNNPNVYITNALSKTVTIDAATPFSNLTVTNLNVYSAGGATNTLYLSSNTNSLNVLGALQLGNTGVAGALVLDGGLLVTTNSTGAAIVRVGQLGVGVMTVSNGMWFGNDVRVGAGSGAKGTLNLAGGTNSISTILYIAPAVGGTGAVLMTGGRLVMTNSVGTSITHVGYLGVGTMTVSNGTWFGDKLSVGDQGMSGGTLTIDGGTNVFSSMVIVGNLAGATGTVNVTGGSFTITNTANTNSLVVGKSGVGRFTMSGGTVTVDQILVTNGANSIFSASGGSLLARTATIGGSFSLTNGTASFSSNLNVTGAGSLSGTNGLFVLSGNFINQSTNRAQFDLSRSTVFFTNGVGVTAHVLSLTNSGAMDMGSNWLNVAQLATNFSIGTLSLASNNNLTVTGMKSGGTTNALYVGWLDLSAWNTNAAALNSTLTAALTLSDINLYYDANDARNAYLNDQAYNIWGGGLLIPIPEPSAAGLILGGALFSAWILRRKGGRE